tara:strand:- start:86 stop:346 length:261 start_codon:yes stop_codon:yes gene_type:complete
LRLAAQDPPDAILLDMMMPVMDDRAVLEQLSGDDALVGIPVVLFTAKANPLDRHAYDSLGCAGLIAKSYDPLTLGGRVVDLLGWET